MSRSAPMRSLLIPLVALALILTPTALAQIPAPPTPAYTLVLEGLPGEFTGLVSNASATAPYQVVLTLTNVVCANPVTVPVTITAEAPGLPAFIGLTAVPSVINITIGQGPHGSGAVGAPGGGRGDGVIQLDVGEITANGTLSVIVTASAPAPAGAPDGCSGAQPISAVTSEAVSVFANFTAPPPPVMPTPETEDTPGVGVLLLLGAVALVARVVGRGKR